MGNLVSEPIVIILGLVALGVLVLHRLTANKSDNVSGSRPGVESEPDRLVLACFGDRQKADRLMMYELKRDARIGKSEARKRALERLTEDRMRS